MGQTGRGKTSSVHEILSIQEYKDTGIQGFKGKFLEEENWAKK